MRTINTKLVGVSFKDRQKNIEALKFVSANFEKYALFAEREPNNPYDSNSVLVYVRPDCLRELGHLSKEIASKVAPYMDMGAKIHIFLKGVTGEGKNTKGVNIEIVIED